MTERDKLLEYIEEIKAIAAASQGTLAKDEVERYLRGMDLDETQTEAVFRYLCSQGVAIQGYHYEPEKTTIAAAPKAAAGRKESSAGGKRQKNLQLYRQEVMALEDCSAEQERDMFRAFFGGDASAKEKLLHARLRSVMELAQGYRRHGVPVEEIIAEGNLGLMNAVSVLEEQKPSFLTRDGEPDMDKIYHVMEMEIRQAIERMIDEMTEEKDWEKTIVARTNLLHEAAKYLAEEMGRVATQEELSEYTKIPIQEIRDITGLSGDAKKVVRPQ